MKFLAILTFWLPFAIAKAGGQQTVKIGTPLHSPPFIFQDQSEMPGLELEIIQNIFDEMQVGIEWVHLPAKRLPNLMDLGHIDGAIRLIDSYSGPHYVSKPYITFRNVAVTLDPKIKIRDPGDLSQFNVVAFYRASENLGEAYAKAVGESPSYLEVTDQVRQVHLLAKKRMQIAVMEERIFEHFARTHYGDELEASLFGVFGLQEYAMIFLNRQLRDRFNEALKSSPVQDKIKKVHERYRDLSTQEE